MWWSFGFLAFFLTLGAIFMGMGVTRFTSHDTSVKSGARNFKV
jgi:hypothetical protein